eukprot:530287-Rhodomonas_salina.1
MFGARSKCAAGRWWRAHEERDKRDGSTQKGERKNCDGSTEKWDCTCRKCTAISTARNMASTSVL